MMDTIVYIWVAMCTGISQSRSMQNINQAERISELEEKYIILADKVKRLSETQIPGKKVYSLNLFTLSANILYFSSSSEIRSA
jgi:hypothetical protein